MSRRLNYLKRDIAETHLAIANIEQDIKKWNVEIKEAHERYLDELARTGEQSDLTLSAKRWAEKTERSKQGLIQQAEERKIDLEELITSLEEELIDTERLIRKNADVEVAKLQYEVKEREKIVREIQSNLNHEKEALTKLRNKLKIKMEEVV